MSVACIMCLTMLILKSSTKMVMGKTGMVCIFCPLRFHPKGNLCGVSNKVQINRPFHSYVQVLVKTSKIIYFNTVEKNGLKMVKYTKFKGDTLKRTKINCSIILQRFVWAH